MVVVVVVLVMYNMMFSLSLIRGWGGEAPVKINLEQMLHLFVMGC